MNDTQKLLKKYGTPSATLEFESRVMSLWDVPGDINLALPALPNKIYCNRDIVVPLEAVFRDLIKAYREGELTVMDSLVTWDGCFNIRKKRGLASMSTHSWGVAVDINAFRNQLGKQPTFSEKFARIWEENGWEWGGRWKRQDGMHFQYVKNL